MRYASVCSGVEAATLAWEPLGWTAKFFAEVEPFPCAVLHHRFGAGRPIHPLDPAEIVIVDEEWKIIGECKKENPKTWRKIIESDLLGRYDEFTKRENWIKQNNELPETGMIPNEGDMTKIEGEKYHGTVDLLVGGTPCQDVSVAGKRKGFAGERSGLALSYISLLATMRPRWFVWENVPGVLSSNDGEDFKAFIRAADEVGYSCAWRVLDAQYVRVDGFPRAIPQRRRRVFVVGHLGTDWRYPASVLFEPDCLPRDTPPRRVKGKGFTTDAERCAGTAKWWDGSENADTLTCTSHNQLMPDKARLQCVLDMRQIEASDGDGSPTLVATDYKGGKAICFDNQTRARNPKETGDICCTLQAAMGTSGNNIPLVQSIAIAENVIGRKVENGGNGTGAQEELSYTLNATGVHGVSQNETVRRLLPVECERLMGFPDNHTRIPWKGKPEEDCPDSPRYKACGNSMCVNVMRWIGMRIELVERNEMHFEESEG